MNGCLAREILPFLRELGVEVVETPVGPETDTPVLQDHIARCIDAGLKVSLHPYSEGSDYNPVFFSAEEDNPCREMHEHFFLLAEEAAWRKEFPRSSTSTRPPARPPNPGSTFWTNRSPSSRGHTTGAATTSPTSPSPWSCRSVRTSRAEAAHRRHVRGVAGNLDRDAT